MATMTPEIKATIEAALKISRVLLAKSAAWDEHRGQEMVAINEALAYIQQQDAQESLQEALQRAHTEGSVLGSKEVVEEPEEIGPEMAPGQVKALRSISRYLHGRAISGLDLQVSLSILDDLLEKGTERKE